MSLKEMNISPAECTAGPAWNDEALAPRELQEYAELLSAWQKADDERNDWMRNVTEKRINAFLSRMEAKHGL